MFEARLLIETHCVRRVAAQGPALAGVLLEAIAGQERSLQDGEVGFIAADREFHHDRRRKPQRDPGASV